MHSRTVRQLTIQTLLFKKQLVEHNFPDVSVAPTVTLQRCFGHHKMSVAAMQNSAAFV